MLDSKHALANKGSGRSRHGGHPHLSVRRAIAALERYAKSAYIIRLRGGTSVISSRYYLPALRALLREARGC